jgi:small subunit ribosomal protein S8
MIANIKNGYTSKAYSIKHLKSSVCMKVLDVLCQEGYITAYKETDKYHIEIILKYDENNKSVITNIVRISKPGRRIYVTVNEIIKLIEDGALYIISTSKGVISSKKIIEQKSGGELICKVI